MGGGVRVRRSDGARHRWVLLAVAVAWLLVVGTDATWTASMCLPSAANEITCSTWSRWRSP